MLSAQINIAVNTDSPASIHDQLVEQIGLQIAAGILQSNERLPSIRAMAKSLVFIIAQLILLTIH